MTCNNVMTLLRENKDSLIAVLEAFVHDPLLVWYLKAQRDAHPERVLRRIATENNLSETTRGTEMNPQAMRVLSRIQKKLAGESQLAPD